MQFIPINTNDWKRKKHFAHYLYNVRCSYSLTVDIDITALHATLKTRELKIYPAQIYMLASAANQFPEFRMSLGEEDELVSRQATIVAVPQEQSAAAKLAGASRKPRFPAKRSSGIITDSSMR